jgi:peroxiredoxin Q/BCP
VEETIINFDMLKINQVAPSFTLPDETGTHRSLEEFQGQFVVLYFYPKDDTPGCTKEACMIKEVYDEFSALGVVVLGVSKDSPESHQQFKTKHELPFTLLSDESGEMIESYEAWGEKSMFGNKYQGILRVTYLIDPAGQIVKVYPKVSPAKHALELLKDLKELT